MPQAIAWILVAVTLAAAWWLVAQVRATTRLAERLLAERESAVRTARPFQTIVEHVPRGVALLDVRGRIVTINHRGAELIGTGHGSLGDREFWDLSAWAEDASAQGLVRNACIQALAGHRNRLELPAPTGDGDDRIELLLQPLLDEAGVPSQILVEIQPLNHTPTPEASEIRVMEVLAMMSQLATRVAHDINNPLAGIRNSFLLVRDGIPPDHPHFAFIGAIDREIDRLATFSRRLHESFDLRAATDPRPTMRAAVMEATMTVRQQNPPVAVDVELGPAARITSSIPGLALRMVIGNAIQDLVDGSSPGGTVTIRATVVADQVVLTARGEAANRTRGGRAGVGPGLEMFQRFAETLGIRVEGSTEDGAAEIRIQVPMASTDPAKRQGWSLSSRAGSITEPPDKPVG